MPEIFEPCFILIDDLIARRKSQGMTQKDLAEAAHLTQSAVARLEGKKAISQLDTLLKVATAPGCPLTVDVLK